MTVELLFNQSLSAAVASSANETTTTTNKKRQPLSSINSNLTPRTPRDGKYNNKPTTNTTITKSKRKRSKSSKKVRSREIYTPLVINQQSITTSQNKQRSTVVDNNTAAPLCNSTQPTILPDEQTVALPKSIKKSSEELLASNSGNSPQSIKPTDDITTIQLSHSNNNHSSQSTILNFGYNTNIVGVVRSLPLRIVAPPTLHQQSVKEERDKEEEISIQFTNIPIGFDIILDGEYDGIKDEHVVCNVNSTAGKNGEISSLQLKQNESKIIHIQWTPKQEGEVREKMVMLTPWGDKVDISLIGIARCSIDCSGDGASQKEQTPIEPSAAVAQGEEKSNITTAVYQARDNITYNAQQWEDEQCKTFMTWLNNIFHPFNNNSLSSSVNESQLTKEWQNAKTLFNSNKMMNIRSAIEREVKEGRLAITPKRNRNVLDEVYVQEQLTKLLLSYTPRWLQLGLGVVLALDDDQFVKMSNEMTRESLKKIILQRVLSEPSTVKKYTGGLCKTPSGKFESQMRISVHQHALSQIMILVFFLDKAKIHTILTDNPCLFETSSNMKSSEEVLLSLCQDCFSKQGSTIRHLDYEGISVTHCQHPLDEYDFIVRNLAVDLKDGVCLAKMIDIITEHRPNLLSSMRLPASTREHKMYNVNIVLTVLRHLGVPDISDITTAHIVAAHQPRVIQLLWSSIIYFDIPEFKHEIIQYKASRLIQSHARRFMSSRSYQLARRGSISFQSLLRGFLVRTAFKRMNEASTLLQKIWRGHHAKKLYERDLVSIIATQSICRRYIARNQVEHMSRVMNSASALIQKIWRGYVYKIEYGCDLIDIITIQAIVRARRARQDFALQFGSILLIQRIGRGFLARLERHRRLSAVSTLQCVCKSFISQLRVDRRNKIMNKASIDIQRILRGYFAKLSYGFDLMDIITAQSACRRWIARKRAAHLHSCVIKVQSIARMSTSKRLYCKSRGAACTIQKYTRSMIASIQLSFHEKHVVYLQKACRGWMCRRQLTQQIAVQVVEGGLLLEPVCQEEDEREALSDDSTSVFETTAYSLSMSNLSPRDDTSSPIVDLDHEVNHEEDGEEISFCTRHARRKRDVCSVGLISNTVDCDTKEVKVESDNQLGNGIKGETASSPTLPSTSIVAKKRGALCNISNPSPDKSDVVAKECERPDHKQVALCKARMEDVEHDWRLKGSETSEQEGLLVATDLGRNVNDRTDGESLVADVSPRRDENAILQDDTVRHMRECIKLPSISTKPTTLMNIEKEASVTTIQSFFRCYSSQTKHTSLKTGVILFQARGRGCLARASFRHITIERKRTAALTIQRLYRGHAALDNFSHIKLTAILIQSTFRKHLHSSNHCYLRKCTVLIQAQVRGWQARRQLVNEQLELYQQVSYKTESLQYNKSSAAIQIQRVWRGSTIKRIFAAKLELCRDIIAVASSLQSKQSSAAIQIQKVFRGFKINVEYMLTVISAIKVQSIVRSHIVSSKYRRLQIGITRIQANFRGIKARRGIALLEVNSIIIQAAGRRFLAKLEVSKATAAVTTLQRGARRMLTRMHSEVEDFAAAEIQRVFRGFKINVDYMLTVMSAIIIQSVVRGRQSRRIVNIQRQAISTIQRAAKNMLNNMHNEVVCFAATEIQRVFRGYRANVNFILMAVSVIKIQSIVRGRRARNIVAPQLGSIRLIQRVFRGFLARLERDRRIASISILQRAARAMIIRRINSEVDYYAATAIQRVFRGYRANVDFMLTVMAAIKIQTFTRSILEEMNAKRLAEEATARRHAAARQAELESLERLERQKQYALKKAENERLEKVRLVAEKVRQQERDEKILQKEHARQNAENERRESARLAAVESARQERKRLELDRIALAEHKQSIKATKLERESETTRNNNVLSEQKQSGSKASKKRNFATRENRDHTNIRTSGSCSTLSSIGHEDKTKSIHHGSNTPSSIQDQHQESVSTRPRTSPNDQIKHLLKVESNTPRSKAVQTIQTSKKFNEVLKAVTNLEKITQLSIGDCEFIVQTNVQNKMMIILQRCNRSSPHLELIRAILSVFINISQYPSTLSRLANEKGIDILIDIVQMFRDKSNIFALSSELLERFLLSSESLILKYSTPENKKRLSSVLSTSRGQVEQFDDIQRGVHILERVINKLF